MQLNKAHILRLFALLPFLWITSSLATVCTVSTESLTFGLYNPFHESSLDAEGSLSIDCDKKTSGTVMLSTGESGTYETRYMQNGAHHLSYNLYTSSSRRNIWGDGSGDTNTVTFNKKNNDIDIYSRIFALQTNVTPGTYSDTITASVNY